MFFIYKRKGRLVVFSFIISAIIILINYEKLPTGNQYFSPVILFIAAILNFLFTALFVRNEVELTEDEFQMILKQQKERFPNWSFSNVTVKLMRISWSRYSSLLFIRNKNWTYIFLVLAVISFAWFSSF
ncbi:hypothetical protein [Clostridium felsineum]|uniref:Uncharacterized protein n=1 Tax=Clostridium felsineum TaxID=36839 RepID=A0A1S8MAF5_9CLOT|nr:hypothetical protein [Clostridium felsineum]URZ08837.1 hypothetical protein CLROS_042310 [Clostridium felsineum]URZ09465.1 hypothetical protein CROST_001360 [Clostridium felsineum]